MKQPWFVIQPLVGPTDLTPVMRVITEDARMPYPSLGVIAYINATEGDPSPLALATRVVKSLDHMVFDLVVGYPGGVVVGGFKGKCWVSENDKVVLEPITIAPKKFYDHCMNNDGKHGQFIARIALEAVSRLLLSVEVNELNAVVLSDNNPANAKRLAKGKKPLYDWHTVTIGPTKPTPESKGGTGAEKRPHDRRGCWHTIKKTGKKYWVNACRVNKHKEGFVFKDYVVKSGDNSVST